MQKFVEEKIEFNNVRIRGLQEDNERLKERLNKTKDVKDIGKWLGFEFESSVGITDEWKAFVGDFRRHIKSQILDGAELVGFNKMHFEVSGFIRKADKYVYFSISDVRYFKDRWFDEILIRTAKNEKDFSGGSNGYTSLKDFKKNVDYLLRC